MSISLQNLNELSVQEFVATLGRVVENSPSLLEPVATLRPFSSVASLIKAIHGIVLRLDHHARLALFCVHPELAGKEAIEGTLTDHSNSEQDRLGLFNLEKDKHQQLVNLNAKYQERFGFPFIICLKYQADLDTVFSQFERRLLSTEAEEIDETLKEICLVIENRVMTSVSDPKT